MANFVLTLCLCICAVGQSSAQIVAATTAALTIKYTDTSVIYECTCSATPADTTNDKWALTKDSATVEFQTAAESQTAARLTSSTTDVVMSGTTVTKTIPKADHTTADYGSYTCAFQAAAGGAAVTSVTSPAVVLTVCSSAPRTMDSLALALVCLMASVVKTKLY